MKKVTLMMGMFAIGLFSSCSTEELTAINDDVAVSQSIQTLSSCTEPGTIAGAASLSSHNGMQITFNWNNVVNYDANRTYVSYIEIAEDPACPAPAGAAPVAGTYSIDVFNTSSLTLVQGISSKCFYWRIVINGYADSVLECTTSTEWMPATYVQ